MKEPLPICFRQPFSKPVVTQRYILDNFRHLYWIFLKNDPTQVVQTCFRLCYDGPCHAVNEIEIDNTPCQHSHVY